jgi:hypothetical protein
MAYLHLELDESQLSALNRLALKEGTSQAALIQEALVQFLQKRTPLLHPVDDVFGLWRDQHCDGVAYQEGMRSEW